MEGIKAKNIVNYDETCYTNSNEEGSGDEESDSSNKQNKRNANDSSNDENSDGEESDDTGNETENIDPDIREFYAVWLKTEEDSR